MALPLAILQVASILPAALPAHVISGPRPSVRWLGAHSGEIVRRFRSGGKSGWLEPDSADGLDRNGRIPCSGFSGTICSGACTSTFLHQDDSHPGSLTSVWRFTLPDHCRHRHRHSRLSFATQAGTALARVSAARGSHRPLHPARLHHRANVHVLTRRHSPAPAVGTHSGS